MKPRLYFSIVPYCSRFNETCSPDNNIILGFGYYDLDLMLAKKKYTGFPFGIFDFSLTHDDIKSMCAREWKKIPDDKKLSQHDEPFKKICEKVIVDICSIRTFVTTFFNLDEYYFNVCREQSSNNMYTPFRDFDVTRDQMFYFVEYIVKSMGNVSDVSNLKCMYALSREVSQSYYPRILWEEDESEPKFIFSMKK